MISLYTGNYITNNMPMVYVQNAKSSTTDTPINCQQIFETKSLLTERMLLVRILQSNHKSGQMYIVQ